MSRRYVILRHECPIDSERPSHWDLMIESDALLQTWALGEIPAPGETIRAEPLADHRTMYLDYEGPIVGGRGSVTRWDNGTYELELQTPREIVVRLTGAQLSGRLRIYRDESENCWIHRIAD